MYLAVETVAAVEGVVDDFDAFVTEARGYDGAKVQTFRGDASLAYHNVAAGLDAVLAEKAAVVASGLKVEWAKLELRGSRSGSCMRPSRSTGARAPTRCCNKQLARGRVLRDIGVSSADTLVKSGNLKASDVKTLHNGSGPLNLARALVKVAAFFKKHRAAVKGMTPFTAVEEAEAAELGHALLKQVKPKGTPRTKSKTLSDAQRDRDCFAALLEARYEALNGWRGRSGGAHW